MENDVSFVGFRGDDRPNHPPGSAPEHNGVGNPHSIATAIEILKNGLPML